MSQATVEATERGDSRWWMKEGDEKARCIQQTERRIRATQEGRRQQDLLHASLYGNVELMGFGVSSYARTMARTGTQLSLNVVKNMTGAVVSRIAAKSKPKPSFLTEGGDWALRRRAKKLEKACDGTLYKAGFYKKMPIMFRDCAVFGTGIAKVYADHDRKQVCIDRILGSELTIDEGEALYGDESVRTMYQRKYYDRQVLIERFPKSKADLTKDTGTGDDDIHEVGWDATCDQVLVTEAWHLPSGPNAKDGKWAIVANGVILDEDEWTRSRFPFAPLRWDAPMVGWFADGLASELCGIQLELNDLLEELQEVHHTIKGKWLIEMMSQVNEQHINDEQDAILRYRMTKPEYVAWVAASPDVYQHLWNLYQKAYEIAGISQLAAQSAKPAGLNSGVAQREYADQQSERFLNLFNTLEEFVLDVTRLSIDSMRELAKEGGFKVKATSGNFLETIDFRENDIEDNAYELKIFPTSMLPSTPAGRKEFVSDMSKAGILDPDELLELFDMPDTEKFSKRRNATRHLTEQMLEEMIETGEFMSPEPLMHLQTALKVAIASYLEYRFEKVPDDKLDLVRRWMVQVRFLMKQAAAAAAAAAAPPPAAPQMAPANDVAPPMPMAAGAEGMIQ